MRKLYAFIKFIAMGSLTLILTACYGVIEVMYGVPYRLLSGRVSIKDSMNSPIPGLAVILSNNSYGVTTEIISSETDDQGVASLSFEDYYSELDINVIDTDGEDNGGNFQFSETTITPYELDESFDMDITVTEAVEKTIQLSVRDVDNSPIEGLSVSVTKTSYQNTTVDLIDNTTDINGSISFSIDTSSMMYQITISDESNIYSSQTVDIDLENSDEVISETVTMELID